MIEPDELEIQRRSADDFMGRVVHAHAEQPVRAHAVLVTDTRVECLSGCWGPEPHLAEYRASDGNTIAANRRKAGQDHGGTSTD